MLTGAGMLGMALSDYRAQVEAGQKWCSGCQLWQPRDEFGVRRSTPEGLDYVCREANRVRALPRMRALRARRAS